MPAMAASDDEEPDDADHDLVAVAAAGAPGAASSVGLVVEEQEGVRARSGAGRDAQQVHPEERAPVDRG